MQGIQSKNNNKGKAQRFVIFLLSSVCISLKQHISYLALESNSKTSCQAKLILYLVLWLECPVVRFDCIVGCKEWPEVLLEPRMFRPQVGQRPGVTLHRLSLGIKGFFSAHNLLLVLVQRDGEGLEIPQISSKLLLHLPLNVFLFLQGFILALCKTKKVKLVVDMIRKQ